MATKKQTKGASADAAVPESGVAASNDSGTVTMDLRQDYRDADGTLYRAGKGRTVPAALAARIGAPKK